MLIILAFFHLLFRGINFFLPEALFESLPPEKVAYFGKHLVIGYNKPEELKKIIEKGGIGGIYLTRKNIENKTVPQIAEEIQSLQAIQKAHGRAPLLVMADQEGGVVEHLSPPLRVKEPLSQSSQTPEVYAKEQAIDLKSLGININLAPVVDIQENITVTNDLLSHISTRALSNDPEKISQMATKYCQTLFMEKMYCTLKHFPGLGRVHTDTHLFPADLNIPLEELKKHEFIPFQNIIKTTPTLVMVGHVIIPEIDHLPASVSPSIIKGILRDNLGFQGIVITDDMSMGAIQFSNQGFSKNLIQSLNASTDLILISYDAHLYYQAIQTLVGHPWTTEELEVLDGSHARLEKLISRFTL